MPQRPMGKHICKQLIRTKVEGSNLIQSHSFCKKKARKKSLNYKNGYTDKNNVSNQRGYVQHDSFLTVKIAF